MERGKNRTDLLAAGRKKLQQFRQKKDHKSSSSRTSSQVKSPQGAGKHDEDENADTMPHVSSAGLESVESSPQVNTIEADAAISPQMVLPVTKLLVTLAEGDSGMTVGQEQTPDGSSSSTMGYGTSGEMEELKDSGDSTDPSSEDRVRWPCQTSNQDPGTSGVELCNGSTENLSESCEIEISKNGRDEDSEITSDAYAPSEELQVGGKADVPMLTSSRVMGVEVADSMPLPLVEEAKKVDEDSSTSESVGTDAVCNFGTGTDQSVGQLSRMEILKDEPSFSSQNHVVIVHEMSKDAGVRFNSGDEAQVSHAAQLPPDATLMANDPRLDTSSSAQDVSESEKEGAANLADVKGGEKFDGKETEEKNPRSFPFTVENVVARTYQKEDPALQKDVEVLLPEQETSTNSIPRLPARNKDADMMEILKRHLYLSSVTKDFLQLQIAEHIDKKVEFDPNLSDEVSRLQDLVKESEERNASINKELDQYKADLQTISSSKKDLEIQCLSARDEIEELRVKVSEIQNELEMSKKGSTNLSAELADCKNVLGVLQTENSKLSVQILAEAEESHKLKAEKECSTVQIEELNSRIYLLTNEMEDSKRESAKLSAELTDCRCLVTSLQMENSNLISQMLSGCEDMNKIKAEKEHLANENMKIAAALSEEKDQLSVALQKMDQLEGELKEAVTSVEKLTEENLYLLSCLDIHKLKVKELVNVLQESCSQDQDSEILTKDSLAGSMDGNDATGGSQTNHADCTRVNFNKSDDMLDSCPEKPPSERVENSDFSEHTISCVIKGPSVEAEEMLLKLEKAVADMYVHCISLGKEGDRVATSGVSKLIQAFESKTHSCDMPSVEVLPVEGQSLGELDSFNLVKEEISNLRSILRYMDLDTEMTKIPCKKKHDNEIPKEIEVEYEVLTLKNNELRRTIDELVTKLAEFKATIDDLQIQLDSTCANAEEMSGRLLNQVESLQKEVNGMANSLEDLGMMKDAILRSTQKLDACTGLRVPGDSDVDSHLTMSVNAVAKMIEDLQNNLEAACLERVRSHTSYEELNRDYTCLHKNQESANRILYRIHNILFKYINSSSTTGEVPELVSSENSLDVKAKEVLQPPIEDFEMLSDHLNNLLNEKSLLHSAKHELELELARRNQAMEELKEQCNNLTKTLEEHDCTMAELRSLLNRRDQDLKELNGGCLTLTQKLENWEMNASRVVSPELHEHNEVTNPEKVEMDSVNLLLVHLDDLVTSVIQEHGEAIQQLMLSKSHLLEAFSLSESSDLRQSDPLHTFIEKEIVPRIFEFSELEEKSNSLTSKNLLLEDEMQILKDNLRKSGEALEIARSELSSKVTELEQSEQRLSSVREKLGIAVAKGKGLVVQRDSLKQSLMETSSELEMCKQELQSKDAKLSDLEARLKSSEADRIEALESELSYIRNSATQFRDYFLQKDSILQKVEETVEELDLPEDFHSKDIVEKVEWLAKSVAGSTSLSLTDWERKSAAESHEDTGLVGMDAWKDGLPSASTLQLDDLNRKYEELQSKIYSLAEQNDMLEQSLRERNSLVQRWEKVLDGIDMPQQLRSAEPEDRIEWLGRKLLEVQQERDSLLLRIENLDAGLVTIGRENELLSKNLDELRSEYSEISDRATQNEFEKDSLQREISALQEKMMEKFNEDYSEIEIEVKNLLDLVTEALTDQEKLDKSSSDSNAKHLGRLVGKLIDSYKTFSLEKCVTPDGSSCAHNDRISEEQNLKESMYEKEQSLVALKIELDEVSRNLAIAREERDAIIDKYHMQTSGMEALVKQRDALQEERDRAMDKYQSLFSEFGSVTKQRDLLQDQLNQEEQRSASTREKLTVAVRKGKGLVQQRDSLKQTLEEMNTDIERLKKELNQQVETLQSKNQQLTNALSETENALQDRSQTLNNLLAALHSIDLDADINIVDPVQKIEWIHKVSNDLRAEVHSSANEAVKSKRAAELLFAELNEVQERVDSLQEDLGKAEAALAQRSLERDTAEAGRSDALSHLEHFVMNRTEEKRIQLGYIMELKDGILELRKGLLGLTDALALALSRDVDLFCSMQSSMASALNRLDVIIPNDLPLLAPANLLSIDVKNEDKYSAADGFSEADISEDDDGGLITEYLKLAGQSLRGCIKDFAYLKEKLNERSCAVDQHNKDLSKMMEATQSRIASQELSSESLKKDIAHFETIIKDKEKELHSLHKNISFLFEACRRSVLELENRRAQMVGKSGASLVLPSWLHREGTEDKRTLFTDDFVRTVADSMLASVESLGGVQDVVEEKQKEFRAAMSDLQREMQEKDVQQNRICAELVSQIRDAEAVAEKFSVDLDSAKRLVEELQSQLKEMKNDRKLETATQEYEQRIKSLMDSLTAKDQEIESLMQALDEEESQMETLQSRNQELEQTVLKNNLALETVEASRSKALTKLSTTLTRFEELHHLSENLLAEIENLQVQMQERDSEISFLRQEVARCTSDVLAKQESNKKLSADLDEVLTWMDTMVLRFGGNKVNADDQNPSRIHSHIKNLNKQIPTVMAELEDLRLAGQNKDAQLDIEKGKVNELSRKIEVLETSLQERESQIHSFGGTRDPGQTLTPKSPDTLEIEPVINKRSALASVTPHARSGRRVNSEQVSVAIDMGQDNVSLDDEDDDKAHGFKSLTMSKIVPRAARPVADRIDGIWVAIERLLMRQPSLRLGLMLYWVLLHAMLAASI